MTPSRCLSANAVIRLPANGLQAITCRAADNGKEFTDCLFGLRKRAATGKHEFDQLCAELGRVAFNWNQNSPQEPGEF